MNTGALPPFNPVDPAFQADPYPVYARYREEDPVHLGVPPIPSMPRCHYVFRYADVSAVLKDERFGRERLRVGSREPAVATAIRRSARNMLLFADPPRHDRLRALMEAAFSPELHAFARRRAEELAPVLLDMALAEEEPDLVQGFAIPFPVLVMSEVLGIPAEERTKVKRWSADIVAITDLRSSADALVRATRATGEVVEYLSALLRERRRSPREDVLSRMISARVDGQALSDEEILANGVLFLAAGHETTVGLIGYGTQALLDHREETAKFASGEVAVTHVVEELLRYTSPVQMTFRIAHEAVAIGDAPVEPGDAVALVIGAANRDPAEFPEAGTLRLARGARRHLAFGGGTHHCLGSTVARAEARAAFRALAPVLGQLSYEPSRLARTDNFLFRALSAFPVAVR